MCKNNRMSNKEISTLRDFSSFFNMENIRSICTLKKSRGISNVMYKVRHNKSRIKKKQICYKCIQ